MSKTYGLTPLVGAHYPERTPFGTVARSEPPGVAVLKEDGTVARRSVEISIPDRIAAYLKAKKKRWKADQEEESAEEHAIRHWLDCLVTIDASKAVDALNQTTLLDYEVTAVRFEYDDDGSVTIFLGMPYDRSEKRFLPSHVLRDKYLWIKEAAKILHANIPWSAELKITFDIDEQVHRI